MRRFHRPPLLGLAFLFCLSALETEARVPFGFIPPEVYEASFESLALRSGDINADGRLDLIVLNNGKGRIDLYLQLPPGTLPKDHAPLLSRDRWQPVLEHQRLDRQSLVTGRSMSDLLVDDFNADGVDDLAYTDTDNRLVVYHGPVVPAWTPAATLTLSALQSQPESMAFDTAGKRILVLAARDIQEVVWDQDLKDYRTRVLTQLPPGGQTFRRLQVMDIDHDGFSDLFYEIEGETYNLAYHLGGPQGFGSARRPRIEPNGVFFQPFDTDPLQLLSLHPKSSVIQKHSFHEPQENEHHTDARDFRSLDLSLLSLPAAGGRSLSFLWADTNLDGRPDLLAHEANKPEIDLLHSVARREFGLPSSHPIPSGCELALTGHFLAGEPQPQLLLFDSDKLYIGLATMESDRIQFPNYVSNQLTVVSAVTLPPETGGNQDRVLAITKDEKAYEVRVMNFTRDADQAVTINTVQVLPLEFINRDPHPPILVDLDQDGAQDVMVCTPHDAAFFLFPGTNGLEVVKPAKGFSDAMVKKKKPTDFLVLPERDGFPGTWVHLDGGSAQFLTMDRSGAIRILNQINLRGGGRLAGLLPLPGDCIGLLDRSRNLVEIHHQPAGGALEHVRDIPIPSLEVEQCELRRFNGDGPELVVYGRSSLVRIAPRPDAHAIHTETLYETDLKETVHQGLMAGDFNGDGQTDILALDNRDSQTMEFIARDEGGNWESAMHFRIFESVKNFRGRRGGQVEPRELITDDLNNDGLLDMVMLIHDRILIYLQDAVPASP